MGFPEDAGLGIEEDIGNSEEKILDSLNTIEISEMMIVGAIAFYDEAILNEFDPSKESLEEWVNKIGMKKANEIANSAFDKLKNE
jgi:hypothetical protein